MADYDSPWKEALDFFFEAFLELFFPQAHADIDWGRPYESLCVIIGRWPVSRCSATTTPRWQPQSYTYRRWGVEAGLRFPTVKLLDYAERRAELEQSDNPFATVILAHLDTQETRQRLGERKDRKFALVRQLLERGWDARKVRQLFRVIDWMMELPRNLKSELNEQISRYQEEKTMPFLDLFDERGLRRGHIEAIETVLEERFPGTDSQIMSEIRQIKDHEYLKKILRAAVTVADPDELRKLLDNGSDGAAG